MPPTLQRVPTVGRARSAVILAMHGYPLSQRLGILLIWSLSACADVVPGSGAENSRFPLDDQGVAGGPAVAVDDFNACEFQVLAELDESGGVVVERFSYWSDGFRILGTSCRPASPGPHPLLIYNHGGIIGLWESDTTMCVRLARGGGMWVLMPEYRGQGGSEGDIEMCLGEVDDVLELLTCSQTRDDVDPDRVALMGWSHGGCVTLRALQRGAQVRAAIDIHGVTDWVGVYDFTIEKLANPGLDPELREVYAATMAKLEQGAGGAPSEAPEAYRDRSPLAFPEAFDDFQGDLLVLHGTEDIFVPAGQACALAAAQGDFGSVHIDGSGASVSSAPPGCEDAGLEFGQESAPESPSEASRRLEVYEGAGHNIRAGTEPAQRVSASALRFLARHFRE